MNNTTLSSYMAQSRAKQLMKWLFPLLVILIALAGTFATRPYWQPVLFPPKVDLNMSAGEVASAAVTEFFTLYHTEGMERWANRVCALSTEEGCQITKHMFGPLFWEEVSSKKVSTDATAVALEVIYEESLDLAETQVWKLEVTLSNSWVGTEPTQTVYAQVMRSTNLEPWKFVRILFEQEVTNLTASNQGEVK